MPKYFFIPRIIEERPPLAATARRAGWVGCNIRLDRVPEAGKIHVVRGGVQVPRDQVIAQWRATQFLAERTGDARGWLIEVLHCVESVGRDEFTLADVYAKEDDLRRIYPANRNIRPKIRQQLQVLRDMGALEFLGRGLYRLHTTGQPPSP